MRSDKYAGSCKLSVDDTLSFTGFTRRNEKFTRLTGVWHHSLSASLTLREHTTEQCRGAQQIHSYQILTNIRIISLTIYLCILWSALETKPQTGISTPSFLPAGAVSKPKSCSTLSHTLKLNYTEGRRVPSSVFLHRGVDGRLHLPRWQILTSARSVDTVQNKYSGHISWS